MGLFEGRRPTDLGVRQGRLKPVPATPNAVSSQATDAGHTVAPLRYDGDRDGAMQVLVEILRATPGVTIVTRSPDYLYAEFRSALMGFVDDVEFYLPETGKLVHVRSASRLGYSDLGANRRRVESLRKQFQSRHP